MDTRTGDISVGDGPESVNKRVTYDITAEDNTALLGGGVILEEDEGWDNIPPGDESLDRYYSLRKKIVDKGYLAYSSGNMYMYIDASRQWSLLMSKDSLARICGIMGAKNVTVNTDDAVLHYYPWLAKRAVVNPSLPLQRSVCVATRRVEISLDGSGLSFAPSRMLLEVHDSADPRACEMCISPAMATVVPRAWRWPGGAAIHNHIAPLFRDPRDLITLLWHVGNCWVDPVQTPRSLMLFGPGGSGKTEVLNALITVLEGCVGVLPDGTFTSDSSRISDRVLGQLVSSRMVTCGDVDLERRALDVATLKTVVSGDYVTLGPYRARIKCSLTIASNGIANPKETPIISSDAVVRRLAIIHMDAKASLLQQAEVPHSQEARVDFLCMCAYVRLAYHYMPISPMSTMLSVCGARFFEVRDMIEECSEPTLSDYLDILSIVQSATNISSEEVGHKVSLVSRDAVVEIGGRLFLRGLRPTDAFLCYHRSGPE